MIILGVDPGYAIVGCGVVEYNAGRFRVLDARAITTPAKTPFEQRLLAIHRGMEALLMEFSPDEMAVEELFFTNNQTTGIAVAEARGVILLSAAQHGVEPYEYGPMQVKQAVVGYGRADKQQVMEMTRRLLSLDELPRPDDVADALAIAICHANTVGSGASRAAMMREMRRSR